MSATLDLIMPRRDNEHLNLTPLAMPASAPETFGKSFTDLLVAYDFSAAAGTALEYATELSRHFGSTVHLISIETPDEHERIMSTGPRVREHVHQDVRRAFTHIETRLRANGIPCNSTFRVGDVPSVLEGTVLESRTDLVILGAFGHGPSDRANLGSTAAHILHVAHCPVLTIGPHAVRHIAQPLTIERLVCVTASLSANHELLRVCNALALPLKARVEVLRVVDPDHPGTDGHEQERQCESLSRAVREKGIPASWSLLYGQPARVIPAHANEVNASLVVLEISRTEQNQDVDQVIVETIRKVRCPVLTVPSATTE